MIRDLKAALEPVTVAGQHVVTTAVATILGAAAVAGGILLSVLLEGINRWTS